MPASTALFKRHPNKYFVETGSYKGDGIQHAIDAGFEQIRSVELSRHLYYGCVNRFEKQMLKSQVELFVGDSSNLLDIMIKDISCPITFWLDGHYSEGCTAKGKEVTPILKELAIIAKHPVKTHTILIDDVRLFGTKHFGLVLGCEVMQALGEINPDYETKYETGDNKFPDDVLVATAR